MSTLTDRVVGTGRYWRRVVFGDRMGLLVFLGAMIVFTTSWQLDVFINDNDTLANTMAAVVDGHLYVDAFPYGLFQTPRTPGMSQLDGRYYGRNYGHIFLALPFFWVLAAVAAGVDLSIAIPVGWSAALVLFARTLGAHLDRKRAATLLGGAVASAALVANLALATPFDAARLELAALQLSTMTSAAMIGVLVYRLLGRMYDRRTGVAAGVGAVVATPVWFWSTLPKRHSLTALLPLASVYLLYRSRSASTRREGVRLRALAYVPVGLTAWVHAPEGLLLLTALGAVDVATAPTNSPRELTVVGAVLGLSLLPMLVTNTTIAGAPWTPPRALPSVGDATTTGTVPTSGGTGGSSPVGTVGPLVERLATFATYMASSVAALTDPHKLFRVFVRSGLSLGLHPLGARSLNLSVLESMPLAGALLALPAVLYRRVSGTEWRPSTGMVSAVRSDPKRTTDLLAGTYALLLVVMYLPRLPVHVMFTVRYLHPLYPLAIYFVVRSSAVRRTVVERGRLLATAYALFVTVGGVLLVGVFAMYTSEVEEAVQIHARVGLAAAALLLYWMVVETLVEEADYARSGAVALALAAAVPTVYSFLSAVAYFVFSDKFALPVMRVVSESLALW